MITFTTLEKQNVSSHTNKTKHKVQYEAMKNKAMAKLSCYKYHGCARQAKTILFTMEENK
jgi:hypothetical protein